MSDGRLYKLIPFYINDNKIVVEDSISLEGSALFEKDIEIYKTKVKNTGLNIENIEKSILEQNKTSEKLFNIKREHILGFELSSAAKVKYEITRINGYLNNNYESNNDENKEDSYNDTYLGNYEWHDENNTIQFELIKKDNKVTFYIMYL